jgi:hypothetical protein
MPLEVFIYNEDTKDAIPTKNLTHVKVDPSVKEIQKKAFRNCESLVEVEFSEGLERIGSAAFMGCLNLRHTNKLPSTLKEIHFSAFRGCRKLGDSIEFPERLQAIGIHAFDGCRNLKRIKILSAQVVIKRQAFAYCITLSSVALTEGLQVIGEFCFFACASLTHVRVPSSVTRIERGAFANCTRLISLELPQGLEMIDLDLDHYENCARPNIYKCRSLVNLVIPSEQHVRQPYIFLMEGLKLGTVVNDFDDLVIKLQHRFDTLPVHRLCYYQSYYQLTETMEKLQKSIDADPSALRKVDYFGMTPFHILALSQTPNLSLFQALLKIYKVDIIRTRDKFGSTPMDYLCLNHTPDSAKLIQSLLQTMVVQRIQWLGLAQWKADMLAALNGALAVGWSSRQREIGQLYFKLATYERLEAMSMLELALWKAKIDERKPVQNKEQLDDEDSLEKLRLVESDLSQEEGDDRQSCRINSGVEVVISNVLPFLDKVCSDDYYIED